MEETIIEISILFISVVLKTFVIIGGGGCLHFIQELK